MKESESVARPLDCLHRALSGKGKEQEKRGSAKKKKVK